MVPGSWPYGLPPAFAGPPGGFSSYINEPYPFAISSAPPLYGRNWPLYCPLGFYQAQTSAPLTYGGWTWNGYPSATYPAASTFSYQAQVPNAYSGTTLPICGVLAQPGVSAGTAPWGSSSASTSPSFAFPGQPPSSSLSFGTTFWGNSPHSTVPATVSPSQQQAPGSSTGSFSPASTFASPHQSQASSASTGTAFWGSLPSTTQSTFSFSGQTPSSSSSIGTTCWGNFPQSTVPTTVSPSQPQAPGLSTGSKFSPVSTFASPHQSQASSSSTGTTCQGCLPSTTESTFAFPSQTEAPKSSLFGGPQTKPGGYGLPTTSFPPRGSRVALYFPSPDDSGSNGHIRSISAMPVYQSKSHEELRLEDYQTSSGPQVSLPYVSSNFSFQPRGGSDVPASNDEKLISNSATPAHTSRPILQHTSSATSDGLGPSCCCGSLLQKQNSAGAETLVNLLTSVLSANTFPFGIGLAGQFSPDTPVLCQLQSSTSVEPTNAVTSSTQRSSPTAFTWPEPACDTAPQKTQNDPESLVSTDKISGQSTEGAVKPSISRTSHLFGVPFPPVPAHTVPQETQNAPETLNSTNEVSGQSTEGTTTLRPFTFPPSPAFTSQCGTSSIPTLNNSAPVQKASLRSTRSSVLGRRCRCDKYKMKMEGCKVHEHGVNEATTSLNPVQSPEPKPWFLKV